MDVCFKGRFRVTSPFGYRVINGSSQNHKGVDLVGLDDINVYAPCDGTIGASTIVTSKLNRTWEWGNYVRLDTADGKYNVFMCHLASRSVTKGQKVKKGDKIGVMGNTGYSFGAHTHFEVRKKGTYTSLSPLETFGIPNAEGVYSSEPERTDLESGNDIVWQLINGKFKLEINEPERAVKALDEAKDNADFMSLYWMIRKLVNGHGF